MKRSPLAGYLLLLVILSVLQGGISQPAKAAPGEARLGDRAEVIAESQSQALTLYQPLQTIQWEAERLSPRGFVFFAPVEWIGDYVYSETDLEFARKAGDRRREAELLAKLALTEQVYEQFDRATQHYRQSLAIAREIGDRDLEAIALGNLGLAQVQRGSYTADATEDLQAYYDFTRQQSIYYKADRRQEGVALGNLGNAYFGADLYAQAIELHRKRLALAKEIGDRSGEAKALGDLSLVYQAVGEYATAVQQQQQQLAIAREIQDLRGQSMALANLGISAHTAGNYSQALNYQQQRLTLARQMKDVKAEAEAMANLAGAYYFLGDNKQAIALYQQAWNLTWEKIHDADVLYGMRGNQALAHLQIGDYNKAQQYLQEYFIYVRSRNNRRGQSAVKNNEAVLRWMRGDRTGAIATLQTSIAATESLRGRLGNNDAYKISIFETQSFPYQNLQAALVAQKQPEQALEAAERGRARAFIELLATRLRQPETSKSASIQPLEMNQIRQIARQQNATLIEYSIIPRAIQTQTGLQIRESELYIWVVKPDGTVVWRSVRLAPLLQNTPLAELVSQSRATIGVRGRGLGVVARSEARDTVAPNSLQRLYQILIAPIAAHLPSETTQRVIFIPQGNLFLVPFAALQDTNGEDLIEQHTISIAPSIQVFTLRQRQLQKTSKSNPSALIVGNPTMPKVVVNLGQPPEQLSPLPGAEQEAIAIAQLLGTQPLLGDRATKASVVQQIQSVRLAHLATHGLLDDFRGLGMPGAIALAPTDRDDGLLTASDILDLQLKADLVTLSACDTGRGRITGDGVIGLSRSFMAAGTPSIIVSLWAVPDAPTAFLMTEFYRQLKQKPDKAQALRQAMLFTKQRYKNPIDWAAFTLIGEAE